jgi:molybdopterin/thiamine biosynthesis adenylyltransferase
MTTETIDTHGGFIRVEGTEARVCQDIATRQALGIRKYGTTVEKNPLTMRKWLQNAYEETLDQAIYLKRAMEEIDKELT